MAPNARKSHPADGATELEVEQAALRRAAAQMRRLGTNAPMCALCGETEPESLTKLPRRLLEEHHLAGRHEGPTAIICLNHHTVLTARELAGPSRALAVDRTELERIAALLIYRGDFKLEEAAIDKRIGEWLLRLAGAVPSDQYSVLESPFPRRRRRSE